MRHWNWLSRDSGGDHTCWCSSFHQSWLWSRLPIQGWRNSGQIAGGRVPFHPKTPDAPPWPPRLGGVRSGSPFVNSILLQLFQNQGSLQKNVGLRSLIADVWTTVLPEAMTGWGPWRVPCRLKNSSMGPIQGRWSCRKEQVNKIHPSVVCQWFAPQANQKVFYQKSKQSKNALESRPEWSRDW